MKEDNYDKKRLLGFLKGLDDSLEKEKVTKPLEIIALGGSAMSLLNLRLKTQDIDLFYRGLDYDTFSKAVERLYPKYSNDIRKLGLLNALMLFFSQ